MPSVLIIENHLLIRYGLRRILSQEYRELVIGEANSNEEAETWLAKRPWDLVILALALPGQDGFHVLQEIRRRYVSTCVLVLTRHDDLHYALQARQMGASGYVCKDADRPELLRALNTVLSGKEYFQNLPSLESVAPTVPRNVALSAREREVILALAAGKRTAEIAAELNLSVKTVSTYKRRILNKLGLHSTADLVHYVIDQHLS
jgi:DNA-binding NarL/FixJ family response regulator